MPAESARRREAAAWQVLIGACIALALLGRLIYLLKPFDNDAQVFIYLGKLVCDGGRFGYDLIDNKFPTVGLMTSAFWRVFGLWWSGYVLTQTAMGLGGAWLLARSAARAFGEQARRPVLVTALVYFNLSVAVYGGFQLETVQSFFAILAAGAAIETLRTPDWRDSFVAGLCAGCAAMWKPSGAAVLGAFAVAFMISHWHDWRATLRQALAAAGGLMIPIAGTIAYLIAGDTLREIPALYHQIARYAADTPMSAWDLLRPLSVVALLGLPLLARARMCRPRVAIEKPCGHRGITVFLIAWLVLELAGVVAQRRMYAYHFLPVIPAAALLVGAFPRRDRASVMMLALMPAICLSVIGIDTVWVHRRQFIPRLAVSDYIATHTSAGDRVWRDPEPRLLLEVDRLPGARIPLTFLFFNYDTAGLDYSRVIIEDFDTRRPKYVVLPADVSGKIARDLAMSQEMQQRPIRAASYRQGWLNLESYVRAHYLPEKKMGPEVIYRRR